MKCPKCGKKNKSDDDFCAKCGHRLKKEVQKITLGLIVSWILGILFGMSALTFIFQGSIKSGTALLLASLILLPPVNKFIKKEFHFELSTGVKIVAVIILFIIYGVTLPKETPTETIEISSPDMPPELTESETDVEDTKESEKLSTTPPIVEPDPITLEGHGQEASDVFSLIEGISVFELENSGSGHFGIWLMDSKGENVDLLVNEIGPFDGSKITKIDKAGDYILDVSAQGDWKVTIKQPRPTTAPKTRHFTGRDQQYAGPFYLDSGLTKFKLVNTGSGHFGIWLMDSKGNNVDLLVNEIGPFDGSKAIGIRRGGIYYFDISAEGNWEINIE